jgi:uncharacterized membrane protein
MPERRATIDRLGRLQMAHFAVIITIMVLELKPPEYPTFGRPAPLWPTALSYAASYKFIAIVWMEPSLPAALRRRSDAAAHLDHLRAFICGVVSTFRDCVGCEHTFGSCDCFDYAAVFVLV